MRKNIGVTDRWARLLLGVLLLSLLVVLDGGIRYIGLIGLIPLATSLMGFCLVYRLFNVNTCRTGARK